MLASCTTVSLLLCSLYLVSSTCHTQSLFNNRKKFFKEDENHSTYERVTGIQKIHTIGAHLKSINLIRYIFFQMSYYHPCNDHKDESGIYVEGTKVIIN